MDATQTSGPQQQPEENTPDITRKKKPTLPILLVVILLFIIASAGSYFLMNNNKQQAPQKQTFYTSPTPVSQITRMPSISIPQDWITQKSNACNLQIPIPPKKPPYYYPSQTTPPVGDSGKYWQYLEAKAPSDRPTDKEFTDIVHVVMKADDEMGSGYVAGNVFIQCGPNTNKYTNEDLLTMYKRPFMNDANHDLIIKETKVINLWGRQVIEVSLQGGMYDSGLTVYLLATDSHIYQILKIAMSTDLLIKETTNQIFTFIQFH